MATTKRTTANETMPAAAPVALDAREERVAGIAGDVADISSYAYALHADARAGVFRDAFWQLGTNAAMALTRFDALWVALVSTNKPTAAALNQIAQLTNAAIDALEAAAELPSTRRCTAALAAGATAVDQVAAMLDGAAR